MSGPQGWHRRSGGAGLAAIAVVALALGLVSGRADVAVLGAPLAVAAALALRRPTGSASVVAAVTMADSTDALLVSVAVDAAADAELVVVRASAYEERPVAVVVTPARARALLARLPLLHSGPQEVLHASAVLVAAGAGFTRPGGEAVARTTVRPPTERVESLLLPPVLSGRPGAHPARRLGDGSDFRDLHPFTPGDRLRRIDWRATARLSSPDDLVVRRTDAVSEATAVVVLDSRDDVGARVAEWSRDRPARKGTGSLDLARGAVGAIAAGYLEAGDRVGFQDLVHVRGSVRTGAGRRQLERIRAVAAEAVARPDGYPRSPTLPSRAIVFLLSTFLDDDVARLAILWRAAGHRVVAVDVLPDAQLDGVEERQRLAHRILLLERANRLERLRAVDVLVIRWADPDRDVRLREASRQRSRR